MNSPPYEEEKKGVLAVCDSRKGAGVDFGTLTDKTLNSDVLPAFCRPTMVTSISVALTNNVSGVHFHGD